MRAAKTATTGVAGQSAVKTQFEKLGWAAVPNPEHDHGTDLWVTPRDARGFDPGLMLGVQVKSTTRPRTSVTVDGEVGWWFRDPDQRHLRHWLMHDVPHLIVLHDLPSGASYWAHITTQAVQWTGKGGKIFVPAAHTLDQSALPALMRAAASTRQPPRWDGSAWSGAPGLRPDEVLRHALVVPRLVAPHPNATVRSLEAHHKIALLAAGRRTEVSDLSLLGEQPPPPDLTWAGRLYAALQMYLKSGTVDGLRACVASAEEPHELAAASAVLCACLVELGAIEVALAVAEDVLARDTLEPVDHAWLSLHRARCLLELGYTREAVALGVSAQEMRSTHPHDVTAAAIAASGAALVFRASAIGAGDVATTIASVDTEVTWWRTQSTAWGLNAAQDEIYREWAGSTEIRFGRVRDHPRLRGVALTAGFVASHDTWSHAMATWIRAMLITGVREPDALSRHLTALYRTGDHQTVGLAVDKVLRDGPALAVRVAADGIDPALLTHTESRAAVELLQRAADVVSPDQANRVIRWILATLDDPQKWVARARPNFALVHHLVRLAAALLPAATTRVVQEVRARIATLAPIADQGDATQWARLVTAVPVEAWTPPQLAALQARHGDHQVLTGAIERLRARRDPHVRDDVIARLRDGDLNALAMLSQLSDIPDEALAAVVAACTAQLREHAVASNGNVVGGGDPIDPGRVLVWINTAHPGHADWEPVIELLQTPGVATHVMTETVGTIAGCADKIDAETRQRLIPLLEKFRHVPDVPFQEPFAPLVEQALAALQPAGVDLLALLSSTDRGAATHVIARTRDRGLLPAVITLARDRDARVRAEAAAVLSWWAVHEPDPTELVQLLSVLVADAGTLVARRVVAEWGGRVRPEFRQLADSLTGHLSARVRNAARKDEVSILAS